jgi:hypothetical protein
MAINKNKTRVDGVGAGIFTPQERKHKSMRIITRLLKFVKRPQKSAPDYSDLYRRLDANLVVGYLVVAI